MLLRGYCCCCCYYLWWLSWSSVLNLEGQWGHGKRWAAPSLSRVHTCIEGQNSQGQFKKRKKEKKMILQKVIYIKHHSVCLFFLMVKDCTGLRPRLRGGSVDVWMRWCLFRVGAWEKVLPQTSQLKGLLPVWLILWRSRLWELVKDFGHTFTTTLIRISNHIYKGFKYLL